MSQMAQPTTRRVALVHDFLLDLRGAERVFLELCELFPDADIFTAVYDAKGTEGRFAHRRVITSGLQRLRPTAATFRALLPFYPAAMEALDLRGYDLVVSSSSAWAHGVIPDEHAIHICYSYNPFRYAWNEREATLAARNPLVRPVLASIMRRWRAWDFTAAQRVDAYVSISETTRLRIHRYFARESTVLHPPVDVARFTPAPVGDHYLVLSEVMAHKRIEVAVRAFSRMGLPLVVAGNGPDSRRLQRIAGPTVTFAGRVSDAEAERLLSTARAVVVTATEEFGIVAVEAQAAGRPVIALRAGGALETVVEGRTGVFFDRPDPESLIAAVRGFDPMSVDPAECIANARRFGREAFGEQFMAIIEHEMDSVRQGGAEDRRLARRPRPRSRGLALQGRRR
jgi:glycosyltransferase involved in cell wall biosynthesis